MPGHSVISEAVWGPTGSPSRALAEAVRALDSPGAFAPAGAFSVSAENTREDNEVRVLTVVHARVLSVDAWNRRYSKVLSEQFKDDEAIAGAQHT